MNYEFELKVTGVKGHCRAGHKEGDIMKVSPLNAGNLCGTAFHAVFPMLLALNMVRSCRGTRKAIPCTRPARICATR